MVKVRKRISFKNILLVVLSCIAVFASFFAVFKVSKQDTKKTLGLTDYTIATLNASGVETESRLHLVSEDFLKVDGMEVKMKDGATVSYKLYFYDEEKVLLSTNGVTDKLTVNYDTTNLPATAKYFKIVITPAEVDGEDVTVNLFNKNTYVKQISVSYEK